MTSTTNYRPPENKHRRIGFYGCTRVVSVEWAGEGKPPRARYVECPCGCGFTRLVAFMWRAPKSGEKGELVINAD